MEEPLIGKREAADINRQVERLLSKLGNPEPPLKLEVVRDALSLNLRYYSTDDESLLGELTHRLKVAGKQIALRPGLIWDAIRKADLKAFFLPDEKRILIDTRAVPDLKLRWTEGHEIGHAITPWHSGYMFGDNDDTLSPICRAIIESEANYACGRLLFLNERFGAEAKDHELNFKTIQHLSKKFNNTLSSTLWRIVQDREPDCPVFGMISAHPHYLDHPKIGTGPSGDKIKHFIRSSGFNARFTKITPHAAFKIVESHANRYRGGLIANATHVIPDDNGTLHDFSIESFCNGYGVLTIGAHIQQAKLLTAVS